MRKRIENILIIAGSGQNAGKTTFITSLIKALKNKNIASVKITPHEHEPTPGLVLLKDEDGFQIFREENNKSNKDSSLFLAAGAETSLFIQAKDEFILAGFEAALSFLKSDQPIIIESASLAKFIEPSLFIFILNDKHSIKKSAFETIKIANRIVISNGENFDCDPEQIRFNKSWKIEEL